MTAETVGSIPAVKLPVWRTVTAAYRETFGNLGVFAGAAAVPFLLSLLVDGLGFKATVLNQTGPHGYAESLILALFEIAWLRFLLQHSTGTAVSLFPGKRILPYLGYTFLIVLLYFPFAVFNYGALRHGPVPILTTGLIYLLYAGAYYFQIRFSFAFVWISLDAPGRFLASWRQTRGNGLRLMIARVLVGIPVIALASLIIGIAAFASPEFATALELGLFTGPRFWSVLVIGNLFIYVYSALLNCVEAQAFSILTGWGVLRADILERFE